MVTDPQARFADAADDPDTPGGYRPLFRFQGVPQVLASSVLARLSLGTTTVLIVLLFHGTTGSFALAGLAVAANSIGFAVVSPLFGKLADRGYTAHILVVVGILQPISTTAFVISVSLGWSGLVSVALAALSGVTYPPVGAITRAGWERMLPRHLHKVAYGTDALLTEMLYILGPMLAALALIVSGPALGLIVGAICVAVGSVLLALTPDIRRLRRIPSRAPTQAASMWSVGSAAVIALSTGMGVAFGMLEVGIPAFASGFPNGDVLGAVLLAVWSIASVVGGVVYLKLPIRASLQTQLLVLVAGNAIGFALLGVAATPIMLGLLLLLGGLLMAPAATAELSVLSLVATPGRTTETFTWLGTGAYVGGAAGAALAGVLIEPIGVRMTLSLSAVFALTAVAAAAVATAARTPATVVNTEKGCRT